MALRPDKAASLEDLAALNDEIAALVRAGVPLESGLSAVARDLPGRRGALSKRLAERVAAGQSLPTAIEAEGEALPAVYRAVVEAGLRSGRLAAALESTAASARRLKALRGVAGLALFYPLLLVVLVWLLIWFAAAHVIPTLVSLDENAAAVSPWMERVAGYGSLWGPLLPILAIGVYLAWWLSSGRARSLDKQQSALWWVPGMRRLRQSQQAAAFAEILALLLENRVGLDRALVLAAEASGSRAMRDQAATAAAALEAGHPPGEVFLATPAIPSFVRWLLLTSASPEALAAGVRQAAQTYHRRTESLDQWIRLYLPILTTVLIGGGITLLYALMIFVPWIRMLHDLAR